MSAEVSVKLKLDLSDIGAQAKKLGALIGINTNLKTGTDSTNQATKAQSEFQKSIKKTTEALKEQKSAALAAAKAEVEAFRKSREAQTRKSNIPKWMSAEQGQKFTDPQEVEERKRQADFLRTQRRFRTNGFGTNSQAEPSPNLNQSEVSAQAKKMIAAIPALKKADAPPILPTIMPGKTPLTNQPNQFKALFAAALGTGVGGPIGGAVAGLLTKANPAIAAVTAVMTGLRYATQEVIQSFQNAKKLYAASITSGMGLGMTQKRGSLAAVMGVSENEIFSFGSAIKYIGDQLDISNQILTRNATAQTAVAYQASIAEQNIKALWSELAEGLAPVIQDLIVAFNDFAQTFEKSDVIVAAGRMIGEVFSKLGDAIKLMMIAVSGIGLAFQTLGDTLEYVAIKINNLIAKIPGAKGMGISHIDDTNTFKGTKDMSAGIMKQWENLFHPDKTKLGQPQAYMKQMPTSSWERMGLNVGGGGGTNYAQKTESNTKKTATAVENLVKAVQKGAINITKPMGIPSTA